MNPKTISINHSVPTSQVEGCNPDTVKPFSASADGKPTTSPIMETNLNADNPDTAKTMKEDQEREDAIKKAKADHKALEEAMIESMTKYNNALSDTFNEIMNGAPVKKAEGK